MDALFNTCLNFTLAQEGGFSDNPRDPGGATYKGITLASLRAYLRAPDTPVSALKGLDVVTVARFYRSQYWDVMQCGVLPAGVDLMLFDHGVNSGDERSVETLQEIVGVYDDGRIGPVTLAAVGARRPTVLIAELRTAHEAFYRGLRLFPTFGNGWLNRLARRYTAAVSLARTPPAA